MLVEPDNRDLSIRRQCELLGVVRSSYYYQPQREEETKENLAYMRLIDEQYMRTPFFGHTITYNSLRCCAEPPARPRNRGYVGDRSTAFSDRESHRFCG
jgi:hypothetical protein